jgi:hypothetical protein
MLIEFVRGWRNYPKDRPFDIADGMAAELIRSGVARRVAKPDAEMAVSHAAMTAETASHSGKRRRR